MDKKMVWALLVSAIENMTFEDAGIIRSCRLELSQFPDKERVVKTLKWLQDGKYLLGCYIPHLEQGYPNADIYAQYPYDGPICLGIPAYSGYILAEKLQSEVLADSPTITPEDILRESFYKNTWE